MSSSTTFRIFLSCGSTCTEVQERFVSAVESHLASHGCTPKTVGRNAYSARQPVEASRDLIGTCHGAVVIAFERTRILSGLDKPGCPSEQQLKGEMHPTVWNQMESAMAYAQKVPILTFVQKDLKRQGMLSDRFEWKAMETDLSPDFLQSEEFRQVFAEWLELVKTRSKTKAVANTDPSELRKC